MLEILYQDEYLVAINKPAGMLVHRSWLAKHETVFVMQRLRDQLKSHVFPIHRLDRPTSGVLLFALTSNIAHQLCLQFSQRAVKKTYLALVRGYLEGVGEIIYPLSPKRDNIADKFSQAKPPQHAETYYQVLNKVEMPYGVGKFATTRYSLLRLTPKTGRKHQIRRHLKHIFHPILGDTQYGDLHQNRAFTEHLGVKQLMLHAESLHFQHPVKQENLAITAPLDLSWQQALTGLHLSL